MSKDILASFNEDYDHKDYRSLFKKKESGKALTAPEKAQYKKYKALRQAAKKSRPYTAERYETLKDRKDRKGRLSAMGHVLLPYYIEQHRLEIEASNSRTEAKSLKTGSDKPATKATESMASAKSSVAESPKRTVSSSKAKTDADAKKVAAAMVKAEAEKIDPVVAAESTALIKMNGKHKTLPQKQKRHVEVEKELAKLKSENPKPLKSDPIREVIKKLRKERSWLVRAIKRSKGWEGPQAESEAPPPPPPDDDDDDDDDELPSD